MHEFEVLGTPCKNCAEPIRKALLESDKVKVSKVAYDLDHASRSSRFRVFAPKEGRPELVKKLDELGFEWT